MPSYHRGDQPISDLLGIQIVELRSGVLIRFRADYAIESAVEVPAYALRNEPTFRAHVAGSVIRASARFGAADGARDPTRLLEAAAR